MAAAESSNSTMEMGTSDQVLVSNKRNKRLTTIIGGVVMLVVIAVTVTLVVVLSGNEGAVVPPESAPLITTEGPTTAVYTTTEAAPTFTTSIPTTTPPTVPPEPETTPPVEPETTPAPEIPPVIELEDIINGVYSTSSFNGTWASGTEILYRNSNGDLILYDVATDSEVFLVQNSSEILQQSSRVTALSPDNSHVVLSYNVVPVYRYSFLARYAAIDVSSTDVIDIVPPGIASNEAFLQNFVWGPDGTSCAFVYLNNIFYKSNLTAEPVQLTTNGQLNVVYNGIPDWVYEEEVFVSSNALWFSANGERLAYVTFDDTNVRVMRVPHYGVPGSVDYQYTQHHEIRYPKAGTTNPTVSVTLLNLETNVPTVYTAPTNLDEPILKTVRFVDNQSIALLWTNRVQNSLIVQVCTQGVATCTQVFSYDEPNGWIDNIPFMFNAAGNAFITILPQAVNGVLYKEIVEVSSNITVPWTLTARTDLAHTVVDILLWTVDDVIWYKATHVNDSAEQHIYSVDANNVINCFTCGLIRDDGAQCLFNDGSINTDGTMMNINCAGPGVPQTFFFNTNGERVRDWDTNDEVASALENILPETIRLQVPIAGDVDADVHIQVPDGYENMTNVPLLVYVYGGPDTALVTKQWSVDWGSSLVSRFGIAIAHIDGRGSGLRGVSNMFALNRQLGTVEIEDQINVTRYLQANLPWLDANRTCIWGWSYGGYAASLALARGGDVFRCAIAVAPVTDWRFYDTIYTERYMDTPQNNSAAYTESSLLTLEVAEAFRSKRLLLAHGTADDNVHYQHAMLLSRLLQRQDVFFTQMTYTDEDHALVGVRPHLYHALEKFLSENML